MVKLETVEFFLQAPDCFAVCVHLGVVAAGLLHDLVDDESGVASDVKPLDPKLDRDMETIDKGLVLHHVV